MVREKREFLFVYLFVYFEFGWCFCFCFLFFYPFLPFFFNCVNLGVGNCNFFFIIYGICCWFCLDNSTIPDRKIKIVYIFRYFSVFLIKFNQSEWYLLIISILMYTYDNPECFSLNSINMIIMHIQIF